MTLLLTASLMPAFAPDRAAAGERFARRLRMLSLTNLARESHDRADVKLNWLLSRYARHHSMEMANNGYVYHSDDDTLVDILTPYHFSVGGENVGVGSTVDGLQDAFMASLPTGRTSCGPPSTTSRSVWPASTGTCG
ncbi:MAG TPA: CAP domain-containing protein [Actinomycetota bacterium]|nr:CAP domain-containing protein [Actinomycetota bacterium]